MDKQIMQAYKKKVAVTTKPKNLRNSTSNTPPAIPSKQISVGRFSLPRKRHLVIWPGLVVIAVAAVLFAATTPHVFAPAVSKQAGSSPDLSWLRIPGSSLTGAGLHISPVGGAIVNQDGSGGQANPPINLTGSHFDVAGDFVVKATFKDAASAGASLDFYGAVPIIYDEWRLETSRLSLSVYERSVTATVWDGSREASVETRNFVDSETVTNVSFESSGGQFVVFANGKEIGSIDDHGVFSSGHIWVGATAKTGASGWELTSLTWAGIDGGNVSLTAAPSFAVKHDDTQALRSLATKRQASLKIGAAIALSPLMTDDKYRSLAGGQFSMLTPENAMKAQFIHPLPNVYNFDEADALVAFAAANDMTVHGHALVFGEANPRWLQDTSVSNLGQVMTDHIAAVVGHYKGRVAEWDVVNEPLADDDSNTGGAADLRDTIWHRAMGEQFIDRAFIAARAADPSAKLYLNEYGLEADGDRWDSLIQLLERLQTRHVPIDGIGFQSHVYEASDHEDSTILRAHIKQLAKMGLMSRISEIDVHGDNAAVQSSEYAGVLSACMSEPTCTSFTTWGITDKYGSTTAVRSYPPDFGDDLLWDNDYVAKPAYAALQQVLKLAK